MPQQPYPKGWFVVAFAKDLAPGDVRAIRYFGRDLVLFRSEAGIAKVLDAFCPHLGAHLGVGGVVVGESVRCPFHAWRFGLDGRCVEVPYARSIPKRAEVREYPTLERNGFVFVHYASDGSAPAYDIPELAEYGAPEWAGWFGRTMRIATHPREIVENVVDRAHFPVVHKNRIDTFEVEFAGERATQRATGGGIAGGPHTSAAFDYRSVATYYGPGYQVTTMDHVVSSVLVNAHTMISENELDLRFGILVRTSARESAGERDRDGSIDRDAARRAKSARVGEAWAADIERGFLEDVAIWEHKAYREKPVLADGDGPVGELRRWYAQFFSL